MQRRLLPWLFVVLVFGASAGSARAEPSSPFAAEPNAAALPELAKGKTVVRSSGAGNLTKDDRARLAALGIGTIHSGAVVMRKIPKVESGRLLGRLQKLAKNLDAFAPSGACDAIVSEGENAGLCTGSVDGPIGRIPVRMPVSAKVAPHGDGSVRLVIENTRAMEAKPLLAWSKVVDPGKLKLVYDLYPTDDGWLVYARVGVDMSAHESSAPTITAAILKLESFLTRDLAKL